MTAGCRRRHIGGHGGPKRRTFEGGTPVNVASRRAGQRRLLGLAIVFGLVFGAGCVGATRSPGSIESTPSPTPGETATSAPTTSTATQSATPSPRSGCRIAASWNNYAEIGQPSFGQGLTEALQDSAIHYIEMDAKSSATEQSAQIDKAVDDGIDALIVLAQDPDGIKPSVERALAHGVPVIALHRAITNPNVLFVGPDEVRMGELAAQAVLAVKPSGRFVVIKGDESQIRSGLLRQGMTRAGLPDVGKSSDTLVNVGETYTPFWDPNTAKTEMDDFLRRNADKVDIAFAEQDGLTDGVMAALDERHLAGKVLVAGIGGELPETALHRIALGLQTVEVVTDPSVEGRVAGEAALALCADHRVGDVTTSGGKPAPLSADGSVTVPAILVPPIAFDRTNLRVALAKHFGTADYVCKDVKPGTVDGC